MNISTFEHNFVRICFISTRLDAFKKFNLNKNNNLATLGTQLLTVRPNRCYIIILTKTDVDGNNNDVDDGRCCCRYDFPSRELDGIIAISL